MIGDICAEIKNYFTYEDDKYIDDWVISNGQVSPTIDFPTDYIRIVGSRKNDGVHKRGTNGFALVDEEFHGAIWIMSMPADFLALVAEITAWQEVNGNVNSANMSPFQSESFGGYSYSKGSNYNAANGSSAPTVTWQSQFKDRLNIYRRIRV